MATTKIKPGALFRQGDVLLRFMGPKLPEAAEAAANKGELETIPADKGRVVLAYGEVTGHAHALEEKYATMYRWEGSRLLQVRGEAVLRHEEHAQIALPEGIYEVIQQKEYTPQEIRRVSD